MQQYGNNHAGWSYTCAMQFESLKCIFITTSLLKGCQAYPWQPSSGWSLLYGVTYYETYLKHHLLLCVPSCALQSISEVLLIDWQWGAVIQRQGHFPLTEPFHRCVDAVCLQTLGDDATCHFWLGLTSSELHGGQIPCNLGEPWTALFGCQHYGTTSPGKSLGLLLGLLVVLESCWVGWLLWWWLYSSATSMGETRASPARDSFKRSFCMLSWWSTELMVGAPQLPHPPAASWSPSIGSLALFWRTEN